MLQPGTSAPQIEVTQLSGAAWRLDDARERQPVILAFFKASCPTCRLTLPFLQRLTEARVKVLAISQDNAVVTQDFLNRFGISIPAAIDKAWDYPASSAFGITTVPSVFLIEPGGIISQAYEGFAKTDLEAIGVRLGVSPFAPGEAVPEFRPG